MGILAYLVSSCGKTCECGLACHISSQSFICPGLQIKFNLLSTGFQFTKKKKKEDAEEKLANMTHSNYCMMLSDDCFNFTGMSDLTIDALMGWNLPV